MIIQYVFLMIYGVFSYSIFKLIVVNQFIMNILLGVFTLIIIFYTLVKIPQLLKIPYKLFLSTVSIIGILVPIFLFIVNYMNIIPIDSDNSMIIGGIGYSIFVLSSLLMFKSGLHTIIQRQREKFDRGKKETLQELLSAEPAIVQSIPLERTIIGHPGWTSR